MKTQNWQPFPQKWIGKGVFVRDGDPEPTAVSAGGGGGGSGGGGGGGGGQHHQASSTGAQASGNLGGTNDDRAGSLQHPTRGTLLTYIFEVRTAAFNYKFDSLQKKIV